MAGSHESVGIALLFSLAKTYSMAYLILMREHSMKRNVFYGLKSAKQKEIIRAIPTVPRGDQR